MKIGTIRDLIAYRRSHDHMIEKRAEVQFASRWGGEWKALTFYNRATQSEQLVLQKGHVDPDKPTLVRMHQMTMFEDTFGADGPRSGILSRSMEIIGEEGSGVIVAINRQTPDLFSRLLEARKGVMPANMDELRDYGVGAQILAELGVHDMILLTNSHHSLVALDGYGLTVVGQRAIDL
jgi:3,4-dihydroxy 2-butanone 4-phosphate synthase / GTP cyclohydrolase II